MILTILSTTIPIVVTLCLGFVAAWHHDFTGKEAGTLNRMVITYAVPLSIFAGTISTSRAYLLKSVPLVIAILIGIIGMYALVYMLCRLAFRLTVSTSALGAVTAAGPAVPFFGPAILGGVFGSSSAIPIAVASIVINVTVVPLTIFLLTLGKGEKAINLPEGSRQSVPGRPREILVAQIKETCKKPLVWAPFLGTIIVVVGIPVPPLVGKSLLLLGGSSAGVALFAAGIVLAAYKVKIDLYTLLFVFLKNIVQPGLVFGCLFWLGIDRGIISQAVITMAIPAMPIIVMLALEYGVAEESAPSILLISTIMSPLTVGAFIALTH
ncbi:AEC family transporter [Nguyenibacter vanlangensis]|uniref:AEC family transporter n=1 Tax=Nguyenibacter vanlangensis TaxID=1216886 RepID=A0ABZ3D099_9PROT